MDGNKSYRTFNPEFPLNTSRCLRKRVLPNFVNIHWHSHLELIYVATGSIEVHVPETEYLAPQGTLCIFPPTKPHCVRTVEAPCEYWSIHISPDTLQMGDGHFFQKEFVQPLRNCALNMPTCLQPEQVPEPLQNALHAIMFGVDRWEKFGGIMQVCTHLLPLCSHTPTPQALPEGNPVVREILDYIHTNYTTKLTLQKLANRVHLHPNYLCALFKKDTGQSVFDHINLYRLDKARLLLQNTQLSIVQIAEQTGFGNVDYFTRKFKETVGITPSAFRKNK